MRTLLLLILLVAGPVSAAGPDVVEAERARVADDLAKLVQRQVWAGAERKYRELAGLGVQLGLDEHLSGATAARELGDIQSAYERLKLAAAVKSTKAVVDWLWDLENNYGHVELLTAPSRSAELAIDVQPFDPTQRKALETAIRVAKQDGSFSGMLPKGAYRFAGQPFTVEPGLSVRIEVSPRIRRQGLIDPVIKYRELPGAVTQPAGGPQTDRKDR